MNDFVREALLSVIEVDVRQRVSVCERVKSGKFIFDILSIFSRFFTLTLMRIIVESQGFVWSYKICMLETFEFFINGATSRKKIWNDFFWSAKLRR